jgi:hypothetical protein
VNKSWCVPSHGQRQLVACVHNFVEQQHGCGVGRPAGRERHCEEPPSAAGGGNLVEACNTPSQSAPPAPGSAATPAQPGTVVDGERIVGEVRMRLQQRVDFTGNDHVDISCQEVDWKIFGEIFLWYQYYVYPSGITSYLV